MDKEMRLDLVQQAVFIPDTMRSSTALDCYVPANLDDLRAAVGYVQDREATLRELAHDMSTVDAEAAEQHFTEADQAHEAVIQLMAAHVVVGCVELLQAAAAEQE